MTQHQQYHYTIFNMNADGFVFISNTNYIIIDLKKAIMIDEGDISYLRRVKYKDTSTVLQEIIELCHDLNNVLVVPIKHKRDNVTGNYLPDFVKAFKL